MTTPSRRPAVLTTAVNIRLKPGERQLWQAAADFYYRGNRADLIRDAVTQHLKRLYAGETRPSPVDSERNER